MAVPIRGLIASVLDSQWYECGREVWCLQAQNANGVCPALVCYLHSQTTQYEYSIQRTTRRKYHIHYTVKKDNTDGPRHPLMC